MEAVVRIVGVCYMFLIFTRPEMPGEGFVLAAILLLLTGVRVFRAMAEGRRKSAAAGSGFVLFVALVLVVAVYL
ncbi:hypothetical protein [Halobacillus sp. BAB-2008]|uniref:hypothetical protein n=1 Tax=Halobacillus sp. BAB-2008 TaxID=1246484 RepID=UPI0002A51A72|nr:hypothetical protein [Halobacillus sp. BAB-2008]ELK45671.1 hypothetical protein D479_14057 [Halobacillus sp. BAB-2008]